MKSISISSLENGMVIGENISDKNANLLVAYGTEVNQRVIERLKREGLKVVTIKETGDQDSGESNAGFKFLEGIKSKFGSVTNIKKAMEEKEKVEKSGLKNDPYKPKLSDSTKRVDKPVIVIKKSSSSVATAAAKEKEKKDESEELTLFLKETKETLKNIVIAANEKGSIIPFVLSEDALKLFNNIITKKDILTNLKKMKAYDQYLYEHGLYCGIMGIVAGEMMGYQKINLFSLALAGLLMDSGMTEVPKEIYDKKAVLKPEEREIVKKHVIKSHSIVGSISQTTDIAKEIVLYHHERIDGTGYPKGKKGDEISEYTKLLTLIDVYHALTSERPYHPAKNHKEAFYTIFMYKGKQFDEKILAETIKRNVGK